MTQGPTVPLQWGSVALGIKSKLFAMALCDLAPARAPLQPLLGVPTTGLLAALSHLRAFACTCCCLCPDGLPAVPIARSFFSFKIQFPKLVLDHPIEVLPFSHHYVAQTQSQSVITSFIM